MAKQNNPKLRKNGGKGTFIGNALRKLKDVSPALLDIVGNFVPGVGALSGIASAIIGDPDTPQQTKEILLAELQKDIAVEQEITKRWEADSKAKDWLPRNIRPLVVANFTLLIDFVLIASQFGRPIAEAYLPILMTMGVTAIGGYFTLREFGKSKHS